MAYVGHSVYTGPSMTLITDQAALDAFCNRLKGEQFITVDTEFLRERTYWPVLCLVQIAGTEEAAAIDPLADGIDLAPVYGLMGDPAIRKVFHAARQDIEIFFHQSGCIPAPLFDSQIAAMVCGFGDAVAYDTLVQKLARTKLDKSSRFTDWSARPLTDRQIDYALADVTHLRVIYEKLGRKLTKNGRAGWLDAEMATLTDPATYRLDPNHAWKRLKPRSRGPRFLAVLREVAAWREREAQSRDVPRNRVVRDEALLEIAAHAPTSEKALDRTRGLSKGFGASRAGQSLLEAVARGVALPEDQSPVLPRREDLPRGLGPTVDLLKVLLKHKCEHHDVAQKLIANTADLEAIAADDDADVPALKGWRHELFGQHALALKHGEIALAVDNRRIRIVQLASSAASDSKGEAAE